MIRHNLSVDIGEARVMWLALSVFQTRTMAEGDDSIVARALTQIENAFSEEEWALYYERYHGKFVVGVDIGSARDGSPIPCDNAEEAIRTLSEEVLRLRNLRGVDMSECDAVALQIDGIVPSDVAYGIDISIKYHDEKIRFWIYPDISLDNTDLTNGYASAKVGERNVV